MAWTNVGFDGTINEAQWASLAGLLGNGYVAAGNGDCLATAVPGARSVSVAAGSLYGDGILSTNSAPETVAMTTPVNGQWYVIALRRTWATNTAALVAIAGATTTTTTPTAPPTSFPTLNTNVGVLTDQPIAWAWCNSANTTVVVHDLRMSPYKQTNPVSVSSVNDRDAKFPAPVQGTTVWRNDIGALETYFGLYNVSTNPGGRSAAGWYQEPIGRALQTVRIAIPGASTTSTSVVEVPNSTISITPKQANSRLFINVQLSGISRSGTSNAAFFKLYNGTGSIFYTQVGAYMGHTPTSSITYLQGMSTNSTTIVDVTQTSTYSFKLYWYALVADTIDVSKYDVISTITITEVAA